MRIHERHRHPGRQAGRGLGCSILGWAVFVVAIAVVVVVGLRTWNYFKLIKGGKLVDLPQFTTHLTASGDRPLVSSSVAPRETVEGEGRPELGNAEDPQLTIVEYADFQCPYSQEAHTVVRRIAAKYGDRVRVIFRHFPLEDIHPDSFQAAIAAECAREQGKFWAYHDKLYANIDALGFSDLVRYAGEIGLDERQFERCLIDGRYRDRVNEDMRTAETVGLVGTPTFFFDGQKVEGSIPEADFERLLDRLLR